MAPCDPRDRYDDLIETAGSETLSPAEFAQAAESEPATVGWVVLGYVFDDEGRLLLIDEPWADGWQSPGGVPDPPETLSAALEREVREETGIEVTAGRPVAIDTVTFEHAETGETAGWEAVFLDATAETTAIDPDAGMDDEEISDAAWFGSLPESVYNRDLVVRHLERANPGFLI